jgi:hypothetical protein
MVTSKSIPQLITDNQQVTIMNNREIKQFLDKKYLEFNNYKFIETDPIQIPKLFSL